MLWLWRWRSSRFHFSLSPYVSWLVCRFCPWMGAIPRGEARTKYKDMHTIFGAACSLPHSNCIRFFYSIICVGVGFEDGMRLWKFMLSILCNPWIRCCFWTDELNHQFDCCRQCWRCCCWCCCYSYIAFWLCMFAWFLCAQINTWTKYGKCLLSYFRVHVVVVSFSVRGESKGAKNHRAMQWLPSHPHSKRRMSQFVYWSFAFHLILLLIYNVRNKKKFKQKWNCSQIEIEREAHHLFQHQSNQHRQSARARASRKRWQEGRREREREWKRLKME